jgi:hypothetical protein
MALCDDCQHLSFERLLSDTAFPWKGTVAHFVASAQSCELCALLLRSCGDSAYLLDDNLVYMAGFCAKFATPKLATIYLYVGTSEALEAWDGRIVPTGTTTSSAGRTRLTDTRLDQELTKLHVQCGRGL